jgi:hypothetical protein
VNHARSPWIARIDADDLAAPERLERQWQFLRANPEHVLVGCGFDLIDESGCMLQRAMNVVSDEAIRWVMLFFNPFPHPGVVFRRDQALACGGYRAECPVAQDFDLWIRLAKRGRLANHPDLLCHKRCRSDSITGVSSQRQLHFAGLTAHQYAKEYLPKAAPAHVVELRNWYIAGAVPSYERARNLAATFTLCCEHVKYSADQHVHSTVRHVQQAFSYKCRQSAKGSMLNLSRAWQWLRLTRQFDPHGKGPSQQIITRMLHSLHHRKLAPAD